MNGGRLSIDGDNITVAGQTAPSPGITLIKTNLNVTGNNIVVSHIAIQRGTGASISDTANIRGDNIVFDHVSTWWGTDEVLSIHGSDNVTLYKSIIAEGLQFAGHEDGEHSKGSLINNSPTRLAMVGTLYANNAARSPRIDGGEIFLANHVVHNWGRFWDEPLGSGNKVFNQSELESCTICFNKAIQIRSGNNATLVNSVAVRGPDGFDGQYFISGHAGKGNLFEENNMIVDQSGNPLTVVNPAEINELSSPRIWPDGFEPLPTAEGFYEVLRTAGPRPGDRDFHHHRLITQIATQDIPGVSEIIDTEDEVGGYPAYKSSSRSLNNIPSTAEARRIWLDEMEDAIAVDRDIDLSYLYGLVGSVGDDRLR